MYIVLTGEVIQIIKGTNSKKKTPLDKAVLLGNTLILI